MSTIPYGRHDITSEDIEAAISVLKGDWLTQGPAVPRFEASLTSYCDVAHAVAMNSATSALHVACVALGLGSGDYLWTSPNTFLASAYAALYCGARVDFVDVDVATGNLSVEALAQKLAAAEKTGRLPKIVMPIHFGGQSCDMQAIRALADQYKFAIVEDASHAIGGHYQGRPVGDCRYSDICVFSFHPVKIVTTLEGGAAVTNSADLAERMRRLRSHGTVRDPAQMQQESQGPWYYEAQEVGWNYRLTDVQAAIGSSQMLRLDAYVARRAALAARYDQLLTGLGLALPHRQSECRSSWHLYTIGWNEERSGLTRRQAFDRLRASDIGVQVHYIPLHIQPYFQSLGFRLGDFPNAEERYATTITLPLYPALSEQEQDAVVEAVLTLLQPAGRDTRNTCALPNA